MDKYCEQCALRLFNTKHHNLKGIGNPYSGNLIIIPNVDYNAYKNGDLSYDNQVEIIKSIISSTGEQDSNFYVLPLIRCNTKLGCPVNDDIIRNCFLYMADDMKLYEFKNILCLGDAARIFLNIISIKEWRDHIIAKSISGKYFKAVHTTKYFVSYSPLVKYINVLPGKPDLFYQFTNDLKRWHKSVTDGYFDYQLQLV